MGVFSKIVKTGAAKKIVDEARKPENQAKLKKGVAQAKEKVAKNRKPR